VIIQDAAQLTHAATAAATRTRLARTASLCGLLLLVHAVLGYTHHWPTHLFNLHLGISLLIGFSAVLQADRRTRLIDKVADAIREREEL
jgi:hypothetical protein